MTDGDPNLRERVLKQVRFDIISGGAEPGTIYSVPALARTLGISTTPIREAMLQLTSDGLLQPLRNRGFKVVEPSLEELHGLFEVRLQLETSAFLKLAAVGLTEVGELMRRADEIAAAVEHGAVLDYLEADRAFHFEMLTRAGNQVLASIVMNLRDKMRLYGIRSAEGIARQHASVAEHYGIIEAVQGRVEIDLTSLITKHIMDWQPVFTDAIPGQKA